MDIVCSPSWSYTKLPIASVIIENPFEMVHFIRCHLLCLCFRMSSKWITTKIQLFRSHGIVSYFNSSICCCLVHLLLCRMFFHKHLSVGLIVIIFDCIRIYQLWHAVRSLSIFESLRDFFLCHFQWSAR